MRTTMAAEHLSARHSKCAVRFFGDVIFLDRFGEAGPAAAAVEFIHRSEKRFAADYIDIQARTMIVPILVSERRLGPALLGDAILFGRQFLFQFFGGGFARSFRIRCW